MYAELVCDTKRPGGNNTWEFSSTKFVFCISLHALCRVGISVGPTFSPLPQTSRAAREREDVMQDAEEQSCEGVEQVHSDNRRSKKEETAQKSLAEGPASQVLTLGTRLPWFD